MLLVPLSTDMAYMTQSRAIGDYLHAGPRYPCSILDHLPVGAGLYLAPTYVVIPGRELMPHQHARHR